MKDRRNLAACAGFAVVFGAVWGCGSDSLPPQDVRNPEPTTALVTTDVVEPQVASLGEPVEVVADQVASDPVAESTGDAPAPEPAPVDIAHDEPVSPTNDAVAAEPSEVAQPSLAAEIAEQPDRNVRSEPSAPSPANSHASSVPTISATTGSAPTSTGPELRFTTPSQAEIEPTPAPTAAADASAIKAPVAASRPAAKPVTRSQPRKQEPRAVDSRVTNHADTAEAAATNDSAQGPTFKLHVADGSSPDQNSVRIALPGDKPKTAPTSVADVKADEKTKSPVGPRKPTVAQVEAAGQHEVAATQPKTEQAPTLARRPAEKATPAVSNPAETTLAPTLAAAPAKDSDSPSIQKEAAAKPTQITSAEPATEAEAAPPQESTRSAQSRLAAKTRDAVVPASPAADAKSPAETDKVATQAPAETKPVATAAPPAAVEAAVRPPLAASDIAAREHAPHAAHQSADLNSPARRPMLVPSVREREVAERDSRHGNSERMLAEISQADVRVAHGFELAQRGALYLARAEFIAGLKLIAQANDAETGTRQFSRAVNAGLLALRESGDFVRQTTSLDEVDIAKIVSGHKTPVLKSTNTSDMAPTVAAEAYYDFAREQLTAASSQQMVASMALYGLAKATLVGAGSNVQQMEFTGQATLLYQTALAVEPRNFRAANDLGVLLANQGQLARAQEMLAQSVSIAPNAATFQNLAMLYARLGDKHLAEQMQAQARDLKRVGADPTGPGVMWVDPTTFASVGSATEAPLPVPVTQKPAAQKPGNAPANAAPEQATPPASVAKRLTDWLPLNTRR